MQDDALVRRVTISLDCEPFGLNPCCAGRCSSTSFGASQDVNVGSVSILVVLDDALVHKPFISKRFMGLVSILVVLDDALVQYSHNFRYGSIKSSQSLLCWTML